jgi:hypothetical protein
MSRTGALFDDHREEYRQRREVPEMLREHQSIVGTATAQLPEMLIPHRTKIRRIPKVCKHSTCFYGVPVGLMVKLEQIFFLFCNPISYAICTSTFSEL